MIEHNVILPSNYSKLAHLTQLCMLNSERRETFPKLFFNQMISFNAHILCNDVASKCVIVEFLAGVWRVARGLHLASDHNVPRKQTHLRKELSQRYQDQSHLSPHVNSTVLLTKVVKPGSDYFVYAKYGIVSVSPQSTTDITAGDVTPIHENLLRIIDAIR